MDKKTGATTISNLPDILTTDQAAAFLQISTNFLGKEIREGRLRARKIARQWRIRKEDLLSYLE